MREYGAARGSLQLLALYLGDWVNMGLDAADPA